MRRYILGSVVDSEKNYVDALKRILEVPFHLLQFLVWEFENQSSPQRICNMTHMDSVTDASCQMLGALLCADG